jgi:pyruvate/2-oxoglutarate/acetoin dehydrogenase E1 component
MLIIGLNKKMKKIFIFFLGFFILSFDLLGWDGYDYEKGTYVEIDKGNLVRAGKDIQIYDYSTGQYKDVEVQSIKGSGSNTEVEIYDYSTGEFRTLDME